VEEFCNEGGCGNDGGGVLVGKGQVGIDEEEQRGEEGGQRDRCCIGGWVRLEDDEEM